MKITEEGLSKYERMRKAMKHSGEVGAGAAARRKHLSGKEKIPVVMHEFKHGTLHSGGSGDIVKNRDQALAIAFSEAGLSRKKKHKSK